MSVKKIKNHGKTVWQARVAYRGLRRAAIRATREEAKNAESDLRKALREEAAATDGIAGRPVTLRQLFEFYVGDLEARGKGTDTLKRTAATARLFERHAPALLDRPVATLIREDVFAYRETRVRAGKMVQETGSSPGRAASRTAGTT